MLGISKVRIPVIRGIVIILPGTSFRFLMCNQEDGTIYHLLGCPCPWQIKSNKLR